MAKSSSPAPSIEASESSTNNVVLFPAPSRPAARERCCMGDEDPLGVPELLPHALGICELAFSIASAVVGQECCSAADEEIEARHERVYAETLELLCKLTSQLVDDIRELHGQRKLTRAE